MLAERLRIANELHDMVVQPIFVAGLALDGALRLVDNREALQRIEIVLDLLDNAVNGVRVVALALDSPTR